MGRGERKEKKEDKESEIYFVLELNLPTDRERKRERAVRYFTN